MATPGQFESNDDSHEPSLAPGARLSHYEITGKIGMGAVYKAIDIQLDRPVAIKVISRESITPGDRRRFAREAHAASALNHPNIVTIYEYDSIDGIDFIAMECVEGKGLNVLLAERAAGAPFPLPLRLDDMRQVASALTTAHQAGIVHRDLKPANIMIATSGQAKVLDFGLAKRESNPNCATLTELTHAGAVLGTPAYMSPEQALGEHTDSRSDIFCFGVILYEVSRGKRPFRGRNSMAILNNSSAAVWFRLTVAYDLLKDREAALNALDRALRAGYPRTEIEGEPELAPLRADHRYQVRMARIDPVAPPK